MKKYLLTEALWFRLLMLAALAGLGVLAGERLKLQFCGTPILASLAPEWAPIAVLESIEQRRLRRDVGLVTQASAEYIRRRTKPTAHLSEHAR